MSQRTLSEIQLDDVNRLSKANLASIVKAEVVRRKSESSNSSTSISNNVITMEILDNALDKQKKEITAHFTAELAKLTASLLHRDDTNNPLSTQTEELRSIIRNQVESINKLQEVVDSQAKIISAFESKNSFAWNTVDQVKVQMKEIIKEQEDEQRLKDEKRNNLVFFGIPEPNTGTYQERKNKDAACIDEICEVLQIKSENGERVEIAQQQQNQHKLVELRRLGKIREDGKARPLLVRFDNAEKTMRDNLLYKSRDLKQCNDNDYRKNVYIKRDLTKNQLESERKLRDELRSRKEKGEEVVIRDGKIVPRLRENTSQ